MDSCPWDTGNKIKIIRDEESTLKQLKLVLQAISASDDCNREVFPFLCQYLFGLCSKSGHFIPPTSTECERLKNSICQREWETALQFGFELPIRTAYVPSIHTYILVMCLSTNSERACLVRLHKTVYHWCHLVLPPLLWRILCKILLNLKIIPWQGRIS